MKRKQLDAQKGIVIRQALSASSGIFTNSPDLIVTGTTAAFDPSSFIDPDAYGWYFSQSPTIAAANYLYVRGLNYNPAGTQQATVYLYFAQSDQLLDPVKWQSSGFTVGGTAQNFTTLSAISQYQYIYTSTPVMWTPAKPTTPGATYLLISWIDNSASPKPPVFPTTPFKSLDDLDTFVSETPQIAMLDTIYRGAFLRQFPGQTVDKAGTGAQTCPDIIVSGANAAKDASSFTTQGSYSPGQVSANSAYNFRNFIYARAINTFAGPATARVYFFWGTTAAPSPVSWSATNFWYCGQQQNWVDLTGTAANQIMISTVPIVWAMPGPGSNPYMLIIYVDNSGSPQPPDFTAFGYLDLPTVTKFVASSPRLAWVQANGQNLPAPSMSWQMPVVAGTGTTNFFAGVQLTNMPTDGTFSLSIPGPDAADTIVAQTIRIPDPNAYVAWPVTYTDQFRSSAVLNYVQGATPVGAGKIVFTLVPRHSSI